MTPLATTESLVLSYKTSTLAQKKQKFRRTLELSDYLHPSLTNEGNILEYYVHKLSQQVFNHLIKEGANASLRVREHLYFPIYGYLAH